MRYVYIYLLFLLSSSVAWAGVDFKLKEAMLTAMLKEIAAEKDSSAKMSLNANFQRVFEETLTLDGAVRYSFKKLPYVYQVTSPDRRLRILTWSAPAGSAMHFYGFAMLRQSRWSGKAKVVPLIETSLPPALLRQKTLEPQQWAGALYTTILQRKNKINKQTYYTLLGLRLADNNYGSKIIDAAVISGDTLRFGAPIFNERSRIMYRVVFEYNPMASMKLEWNKRLGKIVFTAMLPPHGVPRGEYQLYLPADSYDGLSWDGQQWVFEMGVALPIDKRLQGRQGTSAGRVAQ
jgi:hypothetical protein